MSPMTYVSFVCVSHILPAGRRPQNNGIEIPAHRPLWEEDFAYRRDRRRPRRALFFLPLEKASPRRPYRPVRAERRRRHLGLRRGILRTGAGIPARRRSRHRRRDRAAYGELEEHHAEPARRG